MKRAFSSFYRAALIAVALPIAGPAQSPAQSGGDFFEARVRPLLIKHCLACHGAEKQESGLRLDSRDAWLEGGDSGKAIVPGDPEKSLLIRAVRYTDPDLKMPPDGKKMSAAEITVLEEWVRRGAPDPRRKSASRAASRMTLEQARQFWSFRPLRLPGVPHMEGHRWATTPLDAYVLKEMRKRGISPVDDADKRVLIRRATFDLTGLPPTPTEIDAFLQDDSPRAFHQLIDRLLASSAYGERWGRHWLDVARYADTAGDGADYPVPEAAAYRDWVVRAFNSDKPFNDFVREQIAGDILARDGPADRFAGRVTATGFLAIGKRYGYKPSPDYQHLDFADVIDSIGRSLLGLSLGCARCHDHKYDPVSAADYYALYGILQSTKWAFPGGEEHKRPANFPALVSSSEVARLKKSHSLELGHLDGEISRRRQELSKLDDRWFAGGVDLAFESQTPGKPPGKPWVWSGPINVLTESQSPFRHVHPKGNRGVRLGSGKPTDGLRYVFRHGLRATPGKRMHFTIDFRTATDSTQKGAYRFYLGRGVVQSLAVECSVSAKEFAVRDGKEWRVVRKVEPGTWYTLRLTLDPAGKLCSGIVAGTNDLTEFKDIQLARRWDGIADTFICDGFGHVSGPAPVRDLDNIGLQDKAFAAPGTRIDPGRPAVDAPATNRRKGEAADRKERIAKLEAEIARLTKLHKVQAAKLPYDVAYGVSEGKPGNARLQKRGEPHRLGKEVPRRFLEVLGGDKLSPKAGSGRLELANWLTRPSNPLTARVFVNRVWQWHFGQGLVSTPSDFGTRGERPSHPQLLDWLTVRFVASGWSVKSLHRLIMNSRTYQLASHDHPGNLQADPGNRWLWRYSRRPLDAESIRDAMLAVSGHLNRDVPKSHPFPPVNTWAFTIHRPFHAIYDSNHRSIYLMVQRNRRHPFLALFDAADPNLSVARRQPTTTPTQALFLMNSPFVHQQADGFARRLLSLAKDDASRVRIAFETAHGRIPPQAELDAAVAFLVTYRKKLASRGNVGRPPAAAAWSALRVLLTSNAFLYID